MSPKLTPKQHAFVQAYVAGEDGVRHNGTAAYQQTYHVSSENVASTAAARLLHTPKIVAEIRRLHYAAQARAIQQLQEWKVVAVAAQEILVGLMQGHLPTYTVTHADGSSTTRRDAATGRVMLEAAREVLERAYPKAAMLCLQDPREELAKLLGVPPEDIP